MKKISHYKIEEFEKKRNIYAEDCLKMAFQYEKDIESGELIAGKLIKQAIKRRKKLHKKYFFNKVAVIDVFRFFYLINITIKNKPTKFKPLPWQCWVTMNMYGYYRSKNSNKRLFRYITIWVSRKSAKTTLAAIFSLYGLTKQERNAEVYFCATTKEQASQALKYLKQIVSDSPVLRKKIIKKQYKLEYKFNGLCIAKPVANEPDKLDGLSPSFSIIDEKHALPNNDLFNIMKTGILARENPQIVTISTSGFDKDYPFFNETEVGKKVLNGDIEDDSTFYAFYQLDSEKEIDNPDMWLKSNPSIKDEYGDGVISLEDLIIDYKKACLTRIDKNNFIVKNLNFFLNSESQWIPDEDYKRCFNDINLDELIRLKAKAYLGFDLSKSRDLTSLVAIVEHPITGKLYTFPEFYFPTEDNEYNKIRPSGIDLTEWIDKNYIEPHINRVINYDRIFERIEWWCKNFEVINIGYDPWVAIQLVEKIKSEIFVDMTSCRQNTSFFNFPMRLTERLIYSEAISMSKNPVLRWNFRNAVVYYDGNNNTKLLKNKSLDSIDGAVAFLMALAMYAEHNFDSVSAMFIEINQSLK